MHATRFHSLRQEHVTINVPVASYEVNYDPVMTNKVASLLCIMGLLSRTSVFCLVTNRSPLENLLKPFGFSADGKWLHPEQHIHRWQPAAHHEWDDAPYCPNAWPRDFVQPPRPPSHRILPLTSLAGITVRQDTTDGQKQSPTVPALLTETTQQSKFNKLRPELNVFCFGLFFFPHRFVIFVFLCCQGGGWGGGGVFMSFCFVCFFQVIISYESFVYNNAVKSVLCC